MSVSRAEIEQCTQIVNMMRLNELQAVLHTFDAHKAGLKRDLVQRIINLMNTTRIGSAVCAKVKEFSRAPVARGGATVTGYNQGYAPRQMMPVIAPRGGFYPQYNNMQPNQPVYMTSKVGGRAETMQVTRLPFYDTDMCILKPSELPAAQGRTIDARIGFSFIVPAERLPLITHSNETPLPRYELQMRLFLLDLDLEQSDDFPPNCTIRIGQANVPLPPIIPTNKPNAEQKRYSRPVDITPYCQPDRRTPGSYKVEIDWCADKRCWATGIWLVYRTNADILHERMMNDPVKRKSIAETKKMIKSMLDGDDDNIALDQLKISLLDPLMKVRMEIPTRTRNCNHLQCFDLMNYLMMNEKRPSWKCPNCPANAHYDNLVVDEYFMDLLKKVDNKVSEVELLRDGNWKVTQVDSDDMDSDDDDHTHKPRVKKELEPSKKPTESDDSIIVLSSDDESPPKNKVVNKKNDACEPTSKQRKKNSSASSSSLDSEDDDSSSSRKRKKPARRDNRHTSSSNDVHDIIVLSDDDDVPSVRSTNRQNFNRNGVSRSTESPASISAPNSNGSGAENIVPTPENLVDEETQNRLMAELNSEIARGMGSFVQNIVARSVNTGGDKHSFPFNTS